MDEVSKLNLMSHHWRMYPRKDSERSTHLTHTFPAFTKDPLVPVAPSLLRPNRPSQVSVASLVDASKLLGKEKMHLSVPGMQGRFHQPFRVKPTILWGGHKNGIL